MSTWIVQAFVVALVAVTCGLLAVAWRHRRLGVAAIGLLVVAVLMWIAAFAAIATDTGDANSFATCDESCSAVHYVSAVAFLSPPLLVALAALAMLVARGSRWRARRAAGQESV